MATFLYRLGGWAFQHRWKVLGAWVTVVALVVVSAMAFSGKTNNKFSVPGTESQQAQELLEQKYPAASGAYARMVFAAPEGEKLTDPENKDAVMASLAHTKEAADVSMVIDPYSAHAISKDGRIGYADVIYPVPADKIDDPARDELAASADPARAAGMQVEFSGGLVTEESESNSEAIGMMVGFVVLAITLGSLLAAGLPLITAIVGVLTGVTALTALTGVFDVSKTAPILATMLGLAVGIDYALFILSRHRQNMKDGMEPRESAAHSVATAGSAVVFAGATVIIALVGLLVVNIPFLTVMGLAAAGTVAIAVLIALTLLPAIMGFTGDRLGRQNRVLDWRPRRARTREKASIRYARFITRRPLAVVLIGLTLLLGIAIPATHMNLGLPDDGSKSTATTERKSYDLLTAGFGPGFNGPLTVVVDAPHLSGGEQKDLANKVVAGLKEFPGVAAVSPATQNEAGDLTVVKVTPTTGPASDETKDLVTALRDKAGEIRDQTGIEAFVTGTTALNIDTADTLNAALPKYVAVVVGLALLLLMIVFRSVLVPIKAAVGFLLSIGASMGLVVWVFQDGHLADLLGVAQPGPIVSFLPILLIGILFGLAMDYEVFLVSRMREAFVHTGKARESIITGYGHSGRVVTAAAIIMTAVFGAFLLSDDPIVKSIGLALAFGVLADAFIVRMTLVPAVMALLGRRAWWMPRRLGRIVPTIDIEGERLAQA
ncbi:MAG TPA: MMPL family transporter [Solirubrobacteraceae bacterium]|nr:MMPL family transporter [Solirubrobacteraceae bacterium]